MLKHSWDTVTRVLSAVLADPSDSIVHTIKLIAKHYSYFVLS